MSTLRKQREKSFVREQQIAELAVQKAVRVTRRVRDLIDQGALSKEDKTPVSLADFAAQAIIVAAVRHNFPDDTIVAEEDAAPLRENPALARRVWGLVSETRLDDDEADALLPLPESLDDLIALTDAAGNNAPDCEGRAWIIDPVDGTKGFLTGGQYTVCLALVEDGLQTVGAIGCPHVNLDEKKFSEAEADPSAVGILVSAVRGQGAQHRPLSKGGLCEPTPVAKRIPLVEPSVMRLCESKFSYSNRFRRWDIMCSELSMSGEPVDIYSTQLRYVGLALGAYELTIRAPGPDNEPNNVWDHAGGALICEESGVVVMDLWGQYLDFTAGRKMTNNFGHLAVVVGAEHAALRAARTALGRYGEYEELLKPEHMEPRPRPTKEHVDEGKEPTTEHEDGGHEPTTEDMDGGNEPTTEDMDGGNEPTTEHVDGHGLTKNHEDGGHEPTAEHVDGGHEQSTES